MIGKFVSKFREERSWVHDAIRSADATGMLITHLPHIRWACGFSGSNGFLIVRENELYLVTDSRYESQAPLEVEGAKIHIYQNNLIGHVLKDGLVNSSDRLVYQPEYMTVAELKRWQDLGAELTMLPIEKLLSLPVALKSEDEIAGMRAAQHISDAVFVEVLQSIQPGIRENELAAKIDYLHRKHGASGMAFDTIVAFGENSALPHAHPSEKKLKRNTNILLDFGCEVNGLSSDMTRTVYFGEPEDEFLDAYSAVQEAQNQAVKFVQDGISASDVDLAARYSLNSSQFGEYFTHSTGHGIGWEVHEWPRISSYSDAILQKGFTITIEPGVYLRNKFGIRIEDTVLVRSTDCERISSIGRDLIIV